jgi:hypothetical protein
MLARGFFRLTDLGRFSQPAVECGAQKAPIVADRAGRDFSIFGHAAKIFGRYFQYLSSLDSS